MSARDPIDLAEVRVITEASAWRIKLSEEGAESCAGFEEWIAADPQHERAWERVQASWAEFGETATSIEVMDARRAALARARRRQQVRALGPARRWALGVAGVAAAIGAVFLVGIQSMSEHYRTGLGERRVVTLSDGSQVALDSSSELRIRYGDHARRLELVRGQARFDVAHDARRPFSVRAGGQTVVATGTAFNVDMLGSKVLVTLLQGRVTVLEQAPRQGLFQPRLAPQQARRSVVLTSGQQLVADAGAAPRVHTASLDRTIAWESGQLVFADETLGSVVERVNRYAARPVRVDPAVAGLKISGVFNTGDVAAFVDIACHYLPVQASAGADGEITLRPRA